MAVSEQKEVYGGFASVNLRKPDLMQDDPRKGDYVKGKEEFLAQVNPDGSGGAGQGGMSAAQIDALHGMFYNAGCYGAGYCYVQSFSELRITAGGFGVFVVFSYISVPRCPGAAAAWSGLAAGASCQQCFASAGSPGKLAVCTAFCLYYVPG